MKTISVFFTLLACLLSIACATPAESVNVSDRLMELGYFIGEENQRVPSHRINGWNRIDDRNLIIRAGVQDRYLVELAGPCFGLNSAFRVGFTTPGRLSRVDRFEDIVVRSPGLGVERCPIRNIYTLLPL